MKTKSLSHCVCLSVALAAFVFAGPREASAQDMWEKLKRGCANMAGGVVEIPGCVSDVSHKSGPLMGFTWGFFKGVGMVPVRTVVGVFEFLTFFVPAPANYDPVLDPPTAFNYWDD